MGVLFGGESSAQHLSGLEVVARPRDSATMARSSAKFGHFLLAVFYVTVFPLTCASFPLPVPISLWQGTSAILCENGGLRWSIRGGLCHSLDHLFPSGPLARAAMAASAAKLPVPVSISGISPFSPAHFSHNYHWFSYQDPFGCRKEDRSRSHSDHSRRALPFSISFCDCFRRLLQQQARFYPCFFIQGV